jgi:hypothetical protein
MLADDLVPLWRLVRCSFVLSDGDWRLIWRTMLVVAAQLQEKPITLTA